MICSVKTNPFTRDQMRELDLAAKERRVCEIKAQAKGEDKVTYKFRVDIGKHSGEDYFVKLWDDAEFIVHVDSDYTEPGGKSILGGHGHGEKLSTLIKQGAEKFICTLFGFEIKQGWNGEFTQLSFF